MSRYVGAAEAARLLGVQRATLYAYVSRGLVTRQVAPDGRTSRYALNDIEALVARGRRAPTGPPPSLDVQIATGITALSEDGVRYRGHDVAELSRTARFEVVAELLWTGDLPGHACWPDPDPDDVDLVRRVATVGSSAVPTLIAVTAALGDRHPGDDPAGAARRLLGLVPAALTGDGRAGWADPDAGRATATAGPPSAEPGQEADPRLGAPDPGDEADPGPLATALATIWGTTAGAASVVAQGRPARTEADRSATTTAIRPLARAVDRALVLLADHELATSTLAVRVAGSVRADAHTALGAGLAVMRGPLHGGASAQVRTLLAEAETAGATAAVARRLDAGERLPGFGHSIYVGDDPRLAPLMEAVDLLPDPRGRRSLVDEVVARAGVRITHRPNVDLGLGALAFIGDLPADAPLFAVARIAGFAAHLAEELTERPVRYRGLARSPTV